MDNREEVGERFARAGLGSGWRLLVLEAMFQMSPDVPRMSFPLSASGTASAWTAVGSVNFSFVMAWRRRASRFKLAKVALEAVAACSSLPSAMTTSGTSSEFSLRFIVSLAVG